MTLQGELETEVDFVPGFIAKIIFKANRDIDFHGEFYIINYEYYL